MPGHNLAEFDRQKQYGSDWVLGVACRDYRWEQYPARNHMIKHPQDNSLMTYRGHKVLTTLIRAYFSPLHTTAQRFIYAGSADGAVYMYGEASVSSACSIFAFALCSCTSKLFVSCRCSSPAVMESFSTVAASVAVVWLLWYS